MYKMSSSSAVLFLSTLFLVASKIIFAEQPSSEIGNVNAQHINVLSQSKVYKPKPLRKVNNNRATKRITKVTKNTVSCRKCIADEAAEMAIVKNKINIINQGKAKLINIDNLYLPYLQVGATRFFSVKNSNSSAAVMDFFVPLWQQSPANLVFTDIRLFDRTGKPFEGNIHLGYRYLDQERQHLYGIYGAFDRRRTDSGNYFNQLTFGVECWLDRLFIGGNFYQPIGKFEKFLGWGNSYGKVNRTKKNIVVMPEKQIEKAMRGGDVEIGYEIVRGLVGYVGSYYFGAKDVNTVYGPKAKLAYGWSLDHGKRILGIFDKIGLETGIQHDKPRGTTWYLSANLKIGLLPNGDANLQGVSRHMIDLVHRDVDIVTITGIKREKPKILTIKFVDKKGESSLGGGSGGEGGEAYFYIDEKTNITKIVDTDGKPINLNADDRAYVKGLLKSSEISMAPTEKPIKPPEVPPKTNEFPKPPVLPVESPKVEEPSKPSGQPVDQPRSTDLNELEDWQDAGKELNAAEQEILNKFLSSEARSTDPKEIERWAKKEGKMLNYEEQGIFAANLKPVTTKRQHKK